MAGISDRIAGFLDNWPIIEKHLNEILAEGTRDGDRFLDGPRDSEISEACGDHGLQACRE